MDTEATKANHKLIAMRPFEDAEHCEHFTADERAAIMAAVTRVKTEAGKVLCTHEGGIPHYDIALYQKVRCTKCGRRLGTVLPTSDGGKTLG